MIKYSVAILLLAVVSCSSETKKETKEPSKIENREDLIVREGNHYTEYYPGKKVVKMEGSFDENNQRHGIWKWHTESGVTVSITEYMHGKRNGLSLVYFANGRLNYKGEYRDDKPIGIWKTYNEKTGKLSAEKDYGIVK